MKKDVDMRPQAKAPFFEAASYMIGNVGSGIVQIFVATYLTIYYTNVAGINAALAGTIIAVSKLFDGLSDILMGHLLNNTRSKWGKARPWLLRIAIPTALCLVLAFSVPASMGATAKIAYVFITYNLLNTVCYTALAIALSALGGYITENQKQRGFFGGVAMLLSIICNTVMATTILKIAQYFGGGDSFSQKGWTAMVIIYGIIIAVTTLIGFLFTNERVTMANMELEAKGREETTEAEQPAQAKIGFWKSIKALLTNKYFLIFVISMVMVTLNGTFGSTAMYYAQYILGDEMLFTPLNNIKTIVALVGVALGFVGMAKFKKRNLVIVGMVTLIIGLVFPVFGPENTTILYIGAAIAGVGTGLAGCVLPGMLKDTLTYGQWKSGFDMMGTGSAGLSFSMKIAGSLGSLLLGWTMSLTHFVEKAPTQSASAIFGLKLMYIWIPAILMVIALVSMLKYDLDDRYDEIVADLAEGKTAADREK